MPDKQITDLPAINQLQAEDLLVVARVGDIDPAKKMTGTQLMTFVNETAAPILSAAQQSAENAEQSAQESSGYALQSQQSASDAGLSKNAAELAQSAAETAKTGAVEAQTAIENMKVAAQKGDTTSVEKSIVQGVVNLLFTLEKGDKGDQGVKGDTGDGITNISKTSGSGAPGTTDTYTITMSSGTTYTFTVYNGANGEGAGDMTVAVYDPTGKATDIFAYVDGKIAEIPTPDVSAQIQEHNTSETAHNDIRTALDGKETAGAAATVQGNLDTHIVNKNNPHGVTAAQIGATVTTNQTVTLLSSGWTAHTDGRQKQTVSVTGITADTPVVIVDCDLTTADVDAKAQILEAWLLPAAQDVTQGNGTLTFYATETPTINIPVNVGVV